MAQRVRELLGLRRALALVTALSLGCWSLHVTAMSISAMPIEGWVVDPSGAPIEDVVVLAHWVLRGPLEGRVAGQMTIMEAITDKNGHYSFPAWGPKYLLNPFASMLSDDPVIHFFKSGYRLKTARNRTSVSRERANLTLRNSDWNGKRIEVDRLDFGSEAYARQFDVGTNTEIRMLAEFGSDCNWKQMRNMLTRMNLERLRLEALGFQTRLPQPEHFGNQAKCGQAAAWLKGSVP